MQTSPTRLFCFDTPHGFRNFYPSEMQVRMCGKGLGDPTPIVPVVVSEDPNGTHWGWWDAAHERFTMIYPTHIQAEMCFTYGSKAEEDRGRSKQRRLKVERA